MARRIPSLARPISSRRFEEEFAFVWARGPAATYYPRPKIIFSEELEKTHRRNPRRYAECEVYFVGKGSHRRRVVYFAPSALLLPARNRLGLFAHEAGHLALWDQPHTEGAADAAALRLFGVEVTYDRAWPGKGLQTGRLV